MKLLCLNNFKNKALLTDSRDICVMISLHLITTSTLYRKANHNEKRLKVIMIGLLLSSIMTGSALAYGTATTSNGFTVNDWYSNSPQNGGSHLYHSSGNDMWKIVNGVETYQSHYSNTTIQRGKNNTIIAQSGRQWSSAKRATSNISYPNGNWGGYGWWGT